MLFKKAILIIHGFAGGTYDQEELANHLELNNNFDVFQFTLPGHDRNLSKVDHKEWIQKSEEQLNWLIKKGYNNIYLIGHSMGGVIATYLASKYNQVKKLVLLAPAFQYLSVVKDKIDIKKSLDAAPKVIKEYGTEEIVARLLKLSGSTIKEFMELVREYYDCPNNVSCPILIVQGTDDHLVSIDSSKYAYETVKSKNKKLVIVDSMTHDVFKDKRCIEVIEIIENFLKYKIDKGITNI